MKGSYGIFCSGASTPPPCGPTVRLHGGERTAVRAHMLWPVRVPDVLRVPIQSSDEAGTLLGKGWRRGGGKRTGTGVKNQHQLEPPGLNVRQCSRGGTTCVCLPLKPAHHWLLVRPMLKVRVKTNLNWKQVAKDKTSPDTPTLLQNSVGHWDFHLQLRSICKP